MTSAKQHGAVMATTIALAAIVLGGAAAAYGWAYARPQFMYSYLTAWLFWTGVSLGSLSLVLLHNLTGGVWGQAVRPLLRGAVSLIPVMGVFALPVVLNPQMLYEWADPSHVQRDAVLRYKQPYLNVEFFQLRAALYFGLWMLLAALVAWQGRSPAPPDSPADRRFRRFSGQGVGLHGLAVTFASVDWMMSLEPHWFSMIYGVVWFAGQGVTALALSIVVLAASERRDEVLAAAGPKAFHDLGKLLLGFIMFWMYVAFSQFFIIWHGNLPEEVVWYNRRLGGGWQWAALSLAALRFALPFLLLLSRDLKRDPRRLAPVALLVFVMHWVEIVWLVEPAVERGEARFVPWLDAALTLAIGGIWWLLYRLFTPRTPMEPIHAGPAGASHG
ncbi:MAG: hypothetical protein DCC67_07110 [Planctomycetota bacterium]|nr:MAG: hypothetical protein DCC67_07110 [Planctomycetota bacterium]